MRDMKTKSVSPLFNSIIEKLDHQLATIPTHDNEGCDIEDSMHLDTYVSSVTNILVKDKLGANHYPINEALALKLIFDEVEERREIELAAQGIAEQQDA